MHSPGLETVRTSAGIESRSRLPEGDRASLPEEWQAEWVWIDPYVFPEAQTAPVSWWSDDAHQLDRPVAAALLRGTFQVSEVPNRAWLRFSADSRCRIWVNGRPAARGPAVVGGSYGKRVAPDWWFHDVVDVSALLQRGRNVVAAEVVAGPDNQTCFSQGHGGFIAEVFGENRKCLCFTGSDWRGIAFAGYRTGKWTGLTRFCDMRVWPRRWQMVDFDDRAWPELAPDTTPRPKLRGHALPPLAETVVFPVEGDRVVIPPADGPVTVRVHFERMLAGHLQFVSRASAGTRLSVGFEEVPGQSEGGARVVEIVLPEGEIEYESMAYFSARAIRMTVTFPPGAGPVELRGCGMVFRSQPLAYRGAFECSEPFLNELWKVCRWTAQLCLQELHLDSPHHQESLGDEGDYLVEMLMGYHAFGDYPLAHVDLRRLSLDLEQGDGAQFHSTYTLLMPDLAADLLLHTGDRDTARATLPAIRRVLKRTLSWRGPEGLLSQAPNYMFIDWIEHAGTNYHHPSAAQGMGAMTAFAVRALRRGAWLLRQLGEGDAEALEWLREADSLAAAFRNQLYDRGRRIFRDGVRGISRGPVGAWLPPDPDADVYTRHTNILAVWAEIVTGTEAAGVLESVLNDSALPEPQPYFQHFLFDAFESAGLYESYAPAQLELWRGMLADHPHTLREMWGRGDYSHAWGGTPLVQMSRRVLGVEPVAAGWSVLRLRPHPLGLAWARGTVPTPRGDLRVRWQREGTSILVQIETPEGVQVDAGTAVEIESAGTFRQYVSAPPPEARAPRFVGRPPQSLP